MGVLIEDEFLRDGLQSEGIMFSVAEKVALASELADCGLRRIQVGSFVNPRRVPQMSGTEAVIDALGRRPGVTFTALALNAKGVERGIASGIEHLSMSVSASEEHSRRNLNQTIDEARSAIRPMIERALSAGVCVRAGIQCAFGSPFDRQVPSELVVDIARSFAVFGAGEINLADTAGMANPNSVSALVRAVQDAVPASVSLSLHLHNTRGLGIANVIAGWQSGVTTFDAALGGAGGCPFLPNATGNVATEDVAFALEQMGVSTGVDWRRLVPLSLDVEKKLGRRLPGTIAHLEREVS